MLKREHESEYHEFVINKKGEKHWVAAEAVVVHLENYESVIVYSERIIDEAKKEEEEKRQILQNALDTAKQANKAKTTFLNSMSHDIRTPMNAIIGFTSLATTHIDNKELVVDYLRKISTSGNHLLSLINDIQDIIQSDISTKRINFFIDTVNVVNEDIMCDKLHLSQIMINLLSNAVKYTQSGGTVDARIVQKSFDNPDYACYEFIVKDTGIGMSEDSGYDGRNDFS